MSTTLTNTEDVRTGLSVAAFKKAVVDSLYFDLAKFPGTATAYDFYMATSYAVRDRLLERWIETVQTYRKQNVRRVSYLSAEYLLGRHLSNNLISLGIYEQAQQALSELGLDLKNIIEQEPEPGLGNGGLGRLAACFMDSLATLEIPAIGFGLRYEYGIFNQEIRDGWQKENSDQWLQYGNPWEIAKPESAVPVQFGGRTEAYTDERGRHRVRWIPDRVIKAVPYDTPIPGYRTNTVNSLRLWKAEAYAAFDLDAFNVGDYSGAVREKMQSETISKILYPRDDDARGKQLRLEQQFFFVSASLQNLIHWHLGRGCRIEDFAQYSAVQMNDTHPSVSVAELMRLLVDEHAVEWSMAWQITRDVLGYTNHTLLPEALERWPLAIFGELLPRHLEIIYEINRRFLEHLNERYGEDVERIRRMSLIDESSERYVRMAHLATIGSHAINGVAELHTELLQKSTLRDFYELYPERFSNKTNGVTPRRWILLSNPEMSNLICSQIGEDWITDLGQLKQLEPLIDNLEFMQAYRQAQHTLKRQMAAYIQEKLSISVDPASMFDVMVKRIHEYKRQHLKVLHIVTLYNRLKKNPQDPMPSRTFIFGGKAAPGYFMAKLIIKLINSVAAVVNTDPDIRGRLKVIFLPDYSVTLGQRVYPSADLSEQISQAGKEASGTGNMKFALNGALTVGTLDGANIEIRKQVGDENFFLFGLTTDQVVELQPNYRPRDYYERSQELRDALDGLSSGRFSHGDKKLFRPLLDSLLNTDQYMLLADFDSYVEVQDKISSVYQDDDQWTKMSILNTARMGWFSSDRTIKQYCADIWRVDPVKVKLGYSAS